MWHSRRCFSRWRSETPTPTPSSIRDVLCGIASYCVLYQNVTYSRIARRYSESCQMCTRVHRFAPDDAVICPAQLLNIIIIIAI
jgi:hypothetical protein